MAQTRKDVNGINKQNPLLSKVKASLFLAGLAATQVRAADPLKINVGKVQQCEFSSRAFIRRCIL